MVEHKTYQRLSGVYKRKEKEEKMKLIACDHCGDVLMLIEKESRECLCGSISGKYLDDKVTAVINSDAIVFGIDNNGFTVAKTLAKKAKEVSYRVDYFITGWIPNHPGEVIVVDQVEDVWAFPHELKDEDKNYTSTLPTESAGADHMPKINHVATKSIWQVLFPRIYKIIKSV